MDPATAFLLLSSHPVQLDRYTALLPGAFMPLALPVECLPADTRTAWIIADENAPIEQRVEAALNAGRPELAWKLITDLSRPVMGLVEVPLQRWILNEIARLKLPTPTNGSVLVVTAETNDAKRLGSMASFALADLDEYLPLPWPRWVGPLVLVTVDAPVDPMPGLSRLSRPALPMLRVTNPEVGALAAAITVIALDLTAPPSGGWPVWFRRGITSLAQRHASGQGMGPLRAREIRQQADLVGLNNLFTSRDVDDELAAAVCAPLINPARRVRFTAFMDLLRNGTSGPGALKVAYGWTLNDLLTAR